MKSEIVRAAVVSNAVRKKVGPIYEAESAVFGSGNSFGGKPVSISLVGNNIQELKLAKRDLKQELQQMPRLADVTDNDPAGIKEIKLQLKENAYLLGLSLNDVMSQVRAGFFGASVQRFQRGRDEIRVWVRYDKENRSSINDLDEMRIVTPSRNRVPLSEIADYTIERGDVVINHLDGRREIMVDADLTDAKDSAPEIIGYHSSRNHAGNHWKISFCHSTLRRAKSRCRQNRSRTWKSFTHHFDFDVCCYRFCFSILWSTIATVHSDSIQFLSASVGGIGCMDKASMYFQD